MVRNIKMAVRKMKRKYVDKEFAHFLEQAASDNDTSVLDLTKMMSKDEDFVRKWKRKRRRNESFWGKI